MDDNQRFEAKDEVRDGARQTTDPTYDTSPTGLVGAPTTSVTGDASRSGLAGSSTFDPRVSPAHEGLAGSPSYQVSGDEAAQPGDSEGE